MRIAGAIASLLALAAAAPGAAPARAQTAAATCPTLAGDRLQFVDVFDGPPEEQAILVPDSASDERGSWSLAYVYDAGRFVTVRCKYSGGRATDIRIPARITQCAYSNRAGAGLTMVCD